MEAEELRPVDWEGKITMWFLGFVFVVILAFGVVWYYFED